MEPYDLPDLRLENPIFQQDNARPHVVRVISKFFGEAYVNFLSRPSRSLIFLPWSMFGTSRVGSLAIYPTILAALIQEVQVARGRVPREVIVHLLAYMPRRAGE